MEKYRPLATVVAIQVNNGLRTTEGLPKWFALLVEEELIKVRNKIKEIEEKYGVSTD